MCFLVIFNLKSLISSFFLLDLGFLFQESDFFHIILSFSLFLRVVFIDLLWCVLSSNYYDMHLCC